MLNLRDNGENWLITRILRKKIKHNMFEFLASGQLCLKFKFSKCIFFHKKKQVTVGLFFYNTWRQYLFIWLFFSVLFSVFLFVCVFFFIFITFLQLFIFFQLLMFSLIVYLPYFFLSPVSNNFKFHIWEPLTHFYVKLARMFLFYQKRECVLVSEREILSLFLPCERAHSLPLLASLSAQIFFFFREKQSVCKCVFVSFSASCLHFFSSILLLCSLISYITTILHLKCACFFLLHFSHFFSSLFFFFNSQNSK